MVREFRGRSMNSEQEIREVVKEVENLLISKGQDYSGNEDLLKGFYDLDNIVSPEVIAFTDINRKYKRIRKWLTDKRLNHEKVIDSSIDLAAYAIILTVILKRQELK